VRRDPPHAQPSGLPTGLAVITTVGPVWRGGRHGEADALASAYRSSLEVAREHALRTVAFPAISTRAYGYPIEQAAVIAPSTIVTSSDGFEPAGDTAPPPPERSAGALDRHAPRLPFVVRLALVFLQRRAGLRVSRDVHLFERHRLAGVLLGAHGRQGQGIEPLSQTLEVMRAGLIGRRRRRRRWRGRRRVKVDLRADHDGAGVDRVSVELVADIHGQFLARRSQSRV
jgi:hypothetical protein